MLIKFVEVVDMRNSYNTSAGKRFMLREASINPEHVCLVRPEVNYKSFLTEGKMPEGLSSDTEFSRVSLAIGVGAGSIVVLGSRSIVEEKLNKSPRVLLKG